MDRTHITELGAFSLEWCLTQGDAEEKRRLVYDADFGLIGGRSFVLPGIISGAGGFKSPLVEARFYYDYVYGEPQLIAIPKIAGTPLALLDWTLLRADYGTNLTRPNYSKLSLYPYSMEVMGYPWTSGGETHSYIRGTQDVQPPLYPTKRGGNLMQYRHWRVRETLISGWTDDDYATLSGLTHFTHGDDMCVGIGRNQQSGGVNIGTITYTLTDSIRALANSSINYFALPSMNRLMFVLSDMVVGEYRTLDVPSKLIVLRPVSVAASGFSDGYGTASDYGRPESNADFIGQEQGRASPYGDYWVGPTAANTFETYRIQATSTRATSLDAVGVEVLFAKNLVPTPADWKIRFRQGGVSHDYSVASNRIGMIVASSGFWHVASLTLIDNPFTALPWQSADLETMEFGILCPAGRNPATVKIAGLNVIAYAPMRSAADYNANGTIPEDTEVTMSEVPVLNSADETLLLRPHSYKFYADVRNPAVLARFDLAHEERSYVLDGSFERLGEALVGDIPNWTLIAGSYRAISTSYDQAYDGLWSLALEPLCNLEQTINLPTGVIGESWKIGGATAYNFDGGGTISLVLGFYDIANVLISSATASLTCAALAPRLWYPFASAAIVVPVNAVYAKVNCRWSGTITSDMFLDSVYAGPDTLTCEDAATAAFMHSTGEVVVGGLTLVSGDWADLKPGMTVRTSNGDLLRLRDFEQGVVIRMGDNDIILPSTSRITASLKVAENTVEWNTVEWIECLDEYRYWVRYPRMVLAGRSATAAGDVEIRYNYIMPTP